MHPPVLEIEPQILQLCATTACASSSNSCYVHCTIHYYQLMMVTCKEIQIILRLFLVRPVQAKQNQSQPPALLTGWEGSLGTCNR